MDWKEMLLNLGTPVIETMIAENLGDVVVFQKSGGKFVVIESAGVVPKKAVYESEEEIREEFPGRNLVRVTEEVYYLLKEIPENFDEIVRIESLSEKLRSVEKLETRITRHIYQLEGMDTIISSLLEPIPLDILLSMMIDAIGELFVASAAFYQLLDDKYALVMNVGTKDFPEVIEAPQMIDAAKFTDMVDAKKFTDYDGLLIPISEELVNRYIIFVRRDDPITPEEKALLSAISKILSKSREYIKSRQKEIVMDQLISQMRFVMESLGEFAVRSLSLHEEEELIRMTVDMIREILQASWAALYESEDGEMWLRGYSSVKKMELPSVLNYEVGEGVEKPGKVEGIEGSVWLAISIPFGDGRKFVIFVGPPITEEFLSEEVKDLYIEIVSRMIKESFENMEYEAKIREREERIRRLYEAIVAIGEFVRDLRKQKSPGEVYRLVFEYASRETGIKGMEVEIGGMPVVMGETGGESFEVEIEGGKVKFFKDGEFSEQDRAILKTLAEGAISTLREMYLLVPDEKVMWIDETVLRFLREKAASHGIDEENLRFYVIKGVKDLEKLPSLGIGLIRENDVIIATDRSEEELRGIGQEIEEL